MDSATSSVLLAVAQGATATSPIQRPNSDSLAASTGLSPKVIARALNDLRQAGLLDGAATMGAHQPHLYQIRMLQAGVRIVELLTQDRS